MAYHGYRPICSRAVDSRLWSHCHGPIRFNPDEGVGGVGGAFEVKRLFAAIFMGRWQCDSRVYPQILVQAIV